MPPRKSGASPFTAACDEAETLQQRAERKRGAEAIPAFEQAAAKFQDALNLARSGGGAATEQVLEAYFGLAECLQSWAQAVLDVCSSLPDAELSAAAEQAAQAQAAGLFQRAVRAYKQVHTGNPEGGMRADAAVNCGNTLASWAELLAAAEGQGDAAARALTEAEAAYQAALQQEDDALTWSNLADVLVQHAELCCERGQGTEAQALYGQAMDAYRHSCELSSSENGDDLPGLLLNWGVALLSMAKHAQDAAVAQRLLGEAAQRLRESISFDRGDVAPHNALGDALMAQAEQLAASDAHAAAAAAAAALQEGYLGALRINSTCPEGLVGAAEAHVQLARLAGGSAAAQQHWGEAAAAYAAALAKPQGLGKWEDRCDVRYNYACCLAQLGKAEEAAALLRQLVAAGAVAAADIRQDGDLAVLHASFS